MEQGYLLTLFSIYTISLILSRYIINIIHLPENISIFTEKNSYQNSAASMHLWCSYKIPTLFALNATRE